MRVFAYSVVGLYRGQPHGFERFRQAVAYEAHRLNKTLFRGHPQGPLPRREVETTIVKSVSKWVFHRYRGTRIWPVSGTGRPDRSQLSHAARDLTETLHGQALRQALQEGGKRRGTQRSASAEARLVEALKRLQAREETITARALAREAGVSPTTASRWLQRMRG